MARHEARRTRLVHVTDQDALLLFNVHHEQFPFVVSARQRGVRWEILVDTGGAEEQEDRKQLRGGEAFDLNARLIAVPQSHKTR